MDTGTNTRSRRGAAVAAAAAISSTSTTGGAAARGGGAAGASPAKGKGKAKRESTSEPPKSQREQDLDTIRSMWEFMAFVHFCNVFRSHLELPRFTEEELEEAMLQPANNLLIADLHIKLLKGILSGKHVSVTLESWRSVLKSELNKRDFEFSSGTNPLAEKEYAEVSVEIRTMMLFELTNWTLDSNLNFLESIAEVSAEDIRCDPLGYDRHDNTYYYFGDRRLYREGPIGTTKKKEIYLGTWKLVCGTLQEWESFIESLKPSKHKDDKFLLEQLEAIFPDVTAKFAYRARKQKIMVQPEWMPPKRSERLRIKEVTLKEKQEEMEREAKKARLLERANKAALVPEAGPRTRGRDTMNSQLRELGVLDVAPGVRVSMRRRGLEPVDETNTAGEQKSTDAKGFDEGSSEDKMQLDNIDGGKLEDEEGDARETKRRKLEEMPSIDGVANGSSAPSLASAPSDPIPTTVPAPDPAPTLAPAPTSAPAPAPAPALTPIPESAPTPPALASAPAPTSDPTPVDNIGTASNPVGTNQS